MFDIEQKAELIPDTNTKELFKEVLSSYQHGNYRSAVVMLWSVVVADILFKLKFLDDVYRNAKAASILKEIKKRQERAPDNPDWEKELLKKAYEELKFITLYEKTNLEYLQKQRHASAHPILTDDNLLLAPNKDTTRSLIRNAMEAILLKTALLNSELVDTIVTDLANNKERLSGFDNIKLYIQQRYFPNISEDGAKKILKALWRFVFNPHNQQEIDNQAINYHALMVFFDKYGDLYEQEIRNNPSSYLASSEYLELIISFLQSNPKIFAVLDSSLKTLIIGSVSDLSQYFCCDFLSSNIEEHYKNILSRMDSEDLSIAETDLKRCFEKAKEKNALKYFFKICIKKYSNSPNFNNADVNYYNYISPFLPDYTLDDVVLLMHDTNCKRQVCNRGRAYWDHKDVLKRFYELGGTSDLFKGLHNWENWNVMKNQEENEISF